MVSPSMTLAQGFDGVEFAAAAAVDGEVVARLASAFFSGDDHAGPGSGDTPDRTYPMVVKSQIDNEFLRLSGQ
jgi:hypothetical protein